MPVNFSNSKFRPKAAINLYPDKEYRILGFLGMKKEWGNDNLPLPYTDFQQQQIDNIFHQMQTAGIDISLVVYEKNDSVNAEGKPDVQTYPVVGRIQPLFTNRPFGESQAQGSQGSQAPQGSQGSQDYQAPQQTAPVNDNGW